MRIDIIGAGIGGLTTAIALEQKGFTVRIFEQAEAMKPVGAGIILAGNAMQVYEKLGLKEIIEKQGNAISSMCITKASLKPLSRVDLSYFEKKFNVKSIAIHRGVLQQILVDKLKTATLYLNHKLKRIHTNKTGYKLEFQHGAHISTPLLIGADGINSTVRQHLFPNHKIRKANQMCWRGITEFNLPAKYQDELNEAWGGLERFGFVKIAEKKVYWYASKTIENSKDKSFSNEIKDYFSHYHTVIKAIISSTKKEQINITEISDLKPINKWYKNNICLIGDAAHATTPNMGQGACQAIEDAYVLAECLKKNDATNAFKTFQQLRLTKAHRVVKNSWKIGKMAHVSNPILIKIRNQMMRCIPASINRKQSKYIFELASLK